MYEELVKLLRNCSGTANPCPCNGCKMYEDNACYDTLMRMAADAIEELSRRVDVRPVVRGKWVNYGGEYRPDIKCCVCGQRKPILLGNFNFNFCPNCGARMEES